MIARILFFTFLLANVGYYGWTVNRRQPTPAVVTPPLRGERLTLLSEQPQRGKTILSLPDQCFELGPFTSQGELRRAFSALEPFVERSRERRESASQIDGYWVFLPAVGSREDAIELGRQLSAVGVRDYYVVTGGDSENTISLGVFDDEINAGGRAQTLIDLGFDAQVRQRTEEVASYWLDYAPRANNKAPWERIIAGDPRLEHRGTRCF